MGQELSSRLPSYFFSTLESLNPPPAAPTLVAVAALPIRSEALEALVRAPAGAPHQVPQPGILRTWTSAAQGRPGGLLEVYNQRTKERGDESQPTPHCTLNTLHFTLYTLHPTLYTVHSSLHGG